MAISMTRDRVFLLAASVGLFPIALSYGVNPQVILPALYDFEVSTTDLTHIFRAIMGLYLALIIFWLLGAFRPALTVPALWSLVVFMLGLAAGRIVSLLVDGTPHWLLSTFLALEICFGLCGAWLISTRKLK